MFPSITDNIMKEILKEKQDQLLMNEIFDWMGYNLLEKEEKDILEEMNVNDLIFISGLNPKGSTCEPARPYLLEMEEEMDEWEKYTNANEARHALIARSPQSGGLYFFPGPSQDQWGHWAIVQSGRQEKSGPLTKDYDWQKSVLDDTDRFFTKAKITIFGEDYHTAECLYGKIHVPLKFNKFCSDIGKEITMIVGIKEADRVLPLACFFMYPSNA